MQSISISLKIYIIGFVVSLLIAIMIKAVLYIIRSFSEKSEKQSG